MKYGAFQEEALREVTAMMRISRVARILPLSVLAFLLWCTGGASPASAQTISVTSANPSSAALGTVNLDVTINGSGFKSGASAQWFVTGTTNPGGVTVNSTRFVSGSQLKANITVAQNAVLSHFDIVVRNATGRTGKGTELFAVTPAYNPQIAYNSAPGGNGSVTINVANADFTDLVPLYTTPSKTVLQDMRFAPTGNRIVFALSNTIYVLTYAVSDIGVTTTSVIPIVTEPDQVKHVDVSPDGTKLLTVEHTADPNQWAVFVMNMNGTGRTQIPLPPDMYYDAVWAHSNSRIAVIEGIAFMEGSGTQTIQIVDLDATNNYSILNLQTILTNTVSQVYQISRVESAHTADSLLFYATPSGSRTYGVYKLDIGTQFVTSLIASGRDASFSADDSTILFFGYNGTADLFTLNPMTNVITQLTSQIYIGRPDMLP